MKLISGNANLPLSQAIAEQLEMPLAQADIRRFSDNEVFVEVLENVRGEDVFIIQPTHFPANDNLMELLVLIDAVRRGSAKRITAVIPYYGYSRQDRKTGPRTPITAKLVANMLEKAGANRVLTIDLHAAQIQGFFEVPTDNLFALPVLYRDIVSRYPNHDNLLVVSPDVGGVVRARALAKRLQCDLAIIDKRREKAGVSEVMNIIGDPQGRHCFLIDDIADSGGTLCNAAQALRKAGALSVAAYVTHGVLSGDAVNRINASELTEFVMTDTVRPTEQGLHASKIRVVSIAPLLAEAILRVARDKSVSYLFE